MEPADIELLRTYQCDGDESAFAQLVERHGGWIFSAPRRRLRDEHLADDAAQAVFVVLAAKAPELVGSKRDSLAAWLFHVMHFACARVKRSQARREKHEELSRKPTPPVATEASLPDGPLIHLMEDSIAQLPVMEREIIVRRFYQRESFAEIGSALGLTAEAARKRISRALQDVKSMMVRDGVDAIPDVLLADFDPAQATAPRAGKAAINHKRIESIAKGTLEMSEQATACEYPVVSAEFFVKDVESNLDFFEKIGFRRRYVEAADAMGRVPRASALPASVESGFSVRTNPRARGLHRV